MKRYAFLLGNTDGLEGVKKDMIRFKSFLQSGVGGAWEQNEICCRCNLNYDEVTSIVETIRNKCCNYVIVYFSGHGEMKRSTKLCLNASGEVLDEEEIFGLASRQLSIYDCCRVSPGIDKTAMNFTLNESVESYLTRRNMYRNRFDSLIEEASEQNIRLYACMPGRYANETNDGGLYTQHLLDVAKQQSLGSDVYVRTAHTLATNAVVRDPEAFSNGVMQYPDIAIDVEEHFPKDLVFALDRSDLL